MVNAEKTTAEPSIAEQIKKDNVLQALLTARNINEAADISGISRKTIYKYLNTDSKFLLAYRDAKREQLRAVSDRMSEGAAKAAEYILNLIDNEEAPASVRLQASIKLLSLYTKFRDIEGTLNALVLRETGSGRKISFLEAFNKDLSEVEYPSSL